MNVNLVLLKKNGVRKVFPLPSEVTTIGRRRCCDLHIPLMSVSKKHCQLHLDGSVLKLRDLASRNGTSLNGKPVSEAVIQPGDFIEVGPLRFQVQIESQTQDTTPSADSARKSARHNKPAATQQLKQLSAENPKANELDSLLDNFFADGIEENSDN